MLRPAAPAPSSLAALTCILLFITAANAAIASIVLPATEWVRMIPQNIGRIRDTLAPLLEVYSDLEHFINDISEEFGPGADVVEALEHGLRIDPSAESRD